MKALRTANFAFAMLLLATAAHAQAKGDWAYLGGDIGDSKYSALDQINAGNIQRLKVAWRTPAIDPAVRAANSTFTSLPEAVVAPAMARLREDLESGAWARRHPELAEREEMDYGYRLVVAG